MFLTWGSLQALSKTFNNEEIYNSGKETPFRQLAVDFAGRIPFLGSPDNCAEFLLLWMNPHKAAHGNYTQGIPTAEFNTFFYKKTVNGMLHPLQGEGESYEEYFQQYRSCSFAYSIREGDKIIPCGFSLNYRLDRPDQWILFSLKNTHLPSEKRKQEDLQIITSFRPEFPRKVAGCFVREISDISAVADSIGVDLLSDYLKRIINEDGLIHSNAGVIKLFTQSINVDKELLNNLYADFKDKRVEAAAERMHNFMKNSDFMADSKDLLAILAEEGNIEKILENEALYRIYRYKAAALSQHISQCMAKESQLYKTLKSVELIPETEDPHLRLGFILLLAEFGLVECYDKLIEINPSFYKLAMLQQKNLLKDCLITETGIGILRLLLQNALTSFQQLMSILEKQDLQTFDKLFANMQCFSGLSSTEYFVIYNVLMRRPELSLEESGSLAAALQALPQGWQTLISRETLADWLIAQDSCSLHEKFSSLATGMQTVLAKMEALASLDKSRTVPNAVKRLLGEKCLANPADDLLAVASVCGSREHIELLYVLAELGVKREELPAIMQNPALTRMSTWLIELNLQASIPLLLAEQQLIEKIKDWDKAWQQACLLLFAQAQIGHDKLEWLKTNLQNDPELASLILQAYAADFSPLQLNNLAFIPEYRSAIRFLNLCQCDYQTGQLTEPCYQLLAAIAAWAQDSDKLENAEFKRYLKHYLTSVLDYPESGAPVHLEPVEAFPECWANSLQALVDRQQAVCEIKALNLPEPVASMLLLPDYQAVLPYLRDLKLLFREGILWLVSDGVRCQLLKEIARLDNPDWQKASLILLAQGPLECSEWLQLLERFKAEGNLANLLCRLHHQGCSANKLKDIPFDLNLYQSLELFSSFGLDIDFDKLTKLVCQMFAGLYLFHKKNPQPLNGYFAQALSFLGSNLPLPSVNDWLDVSEQLLLSQPEEKEEIKKEIQELVFNHLYVLNVAETANRAEELVFNHPDRIRRMSVFIGEPIQGKRIENTPPLDFNQQTVKKLDSVSDELFDNASTFYDKIPDKARTLIPLHLLLTEPLILQALKQIYKISPESLEDKAVTELACNSEAKGHDFRCLLQSLHPEKNYSENIVNFLASGINSRREISSKELKQEVNPEIRRLSVVLDRRLLLINRLRALDLGDEYIDLLCDPNEQGLRFRRIVETVEYKCHELRSRLEKENRAKYKLLVVSENKPEAEYRKALYSIAYEAVTARDGWSKAEILQEIRGKADTKIYDIVKADNSGAAHAARITMKFLANFLSIVLTLGAANLIQGCMKGSFAGCLFFSGTKSKREVDEIGRDVVNLIAPSA